MRAVSSVVTCSMVLASSFSRRGIHLFLRRSTTSRHRNLILVGTLSFLVSACSRWKYPSTSGLDRGDASKFLPTAQRHNRGASVSESQRVS
jgi:hypothetical protein